MDPDVELLAQSLDGWLRRDEAEEDLAAYFTEPHDAHASLFSGRYFERLGGAGDSPEVADRFTAADLVAVQMLSVEVPAEASISILHGELGRSLSRYLREIPSDAALGDPEAAQYVVAGSPADQAWHLLNDQAGTGYVTAGKLLARKRPHLLPIYDSVVRCALGAPAKFWESLHEVLAEDRAGVRGRLDQLRSIGLAPWEVSRLRILDVVVWMGHRNDHTRQGCKAPGAPTPRS